MLALIPYKAYTVKVAKLRHILLNYLYDFTPLYSGVQLVVGLSALPVMWDPLCMPL